MPKTKNLTLKFTEKEYLSILRKAKSKGLRAASFLGLIITDSLISKSYKDIEIPENMHHRQLAEKK